MFLLKRKNNLCQALQKLVETVESNFQMKEGSYVQEPVDKKEI
jgi:hypothetical protein